MRLFSRWDEAAVNSFGTPALFSLARHALAAWLVVAWLAPIACAEIIIDDFDDDLRIDLPDDRRFVSTNIGSIPASRSITTHALQTNPAGVIDINQTSPSTLVASIPTTEHAGPHPTLAIGIVYTFSASLLDGIDLTESGKSNAVILDFSHLTADISLPRLQVSAVHNGSTYASALTPAPQNADSFSVAFPFDSFRLYRGDARDDFDFTSITQLRIHLRLALRNPSLPEELDFEMGLERVRIGGIVPEPSTIASITLMLSILGGFRWARSSSRDVDG